jgi:hypothetical protein
MHRISRVNDWLTKNADAVATATGLERGRLVLSSADETVLLDVARIAAHDSGDRTNAPLLCYLVGLAVGLSGTDLETAAAAVSKSTD